MSIKPENKWPDTDIVLHKKCKVSFVTDIPVMSGATIVINILNHTSKKFVDGAKFALNLQFPLITQKGLVLNFVPVLMLPCIYWLHDMPCVAIFTFFVLPNIAV